MPNAAKRRSRGTRHAARGFACAILCGLASGGCWSQIFAGVAPGDDALVLSNFPASGLQVVVGTDVVAAPPMAEPVVMAGRRAGPSEALRRLIDEAGRKTEVSARLLHAIIAVESRYDANAVSGKGAIGLMQLLPATGKRFGAKDLFSIQDNVYAGAGYLKWLMSLFGDDLELVLAAYNAGEQAVIRAGRRIPPFPETQAYVKRVMANLQR